MEGNINLLHYSCPVTLEGQIVAIADEIAQRQHDLDDGFMDGSLNIDLRDFIGNLLNELCEVNNDIEDDIHKNICIDMIDDLKKIHEDFKSKTINLDLARDLIIRWLLNYMIFDVDLQSKKILNKETIKTFCYKDNICYSQKYIDFSSFGEKINIYFADYISSKVVNSYEINSQDGKAMYVIRNLFKAFYNNPRQMPKYVLESIYNKLKDLSNLYSDTTCIGDYFKVGKLDTIRKIELNKLIAVLRLDYDAYISGFITKELHEGICFFPEAIINFIKKNEDKNIIEPDKLDGVEKFIYQMNHIYVFEICDYISGMTDNYCLSEYKKLFQVD